MAAPTLDAFRALCKISAPVVAPIAKYQKWWEQQPRDDHGKWTSGFASHAFAPSDNDGGGQADAPESPKNGWESEPGWMGATAQHGVATSSPEMGAATGDGMGYLPSSHAFEKPADLAAAEAGAKQLSAHIESGDFDAAKKLLHSNPSIMFAFRKQHHGSVKAAKRAAAFLNATTDATWVQHGTFVNKPKAQPPKEALPGASEPAAPTAPKPVGAPKLIPFDPKIGGPVKGTMGAAIAQEDAQKIHAMLGEGNVAGARAIALNNPQALHALYGMKHGSVLEAKSAASFLHLVTGLTFAQHGTAVNMPKGAIPASSWAHPGFGGTGAPGYTPGATPNASLTANTAPQAAQDAPKQAEPIIPPPGVAPPPSAAEQAKNEASAPSEAWAPVEATPLSGIPKVGGTNPGGFYTLGDGTKGYAKFYDNVEQMQTEALANSIYRAVGINAPDSRLVTINGKKAIFSPIIEGTQHTGGVTNLSTMKLATHPQIRAGFAADAILANHDVVGLDHDNVIVGHDGQAHRMDNGGSLKYRAQGQLKNPYSADAVPELDSMRNPKYGAGKVFQGLTDVDVAKQVMGFAVKMKPAEVEALAKKAGFSGESLKEHAGTINGRIAAALDWAESKFPEGTSLHGAANSIKQHHDALASSADPTAAVAPQAPLGNKLLEGINTSVPLDAENALTKPLTSKEQWQIVPGAAAAISAKDPHAFAKAVTASPSILAKMSQYTHYSPWAATQMAEIMTHLTGKKHEAVAGANGHAVKLVDAPVIAHPPDKINSQDLVSESMPYAGQPLTSVLQAAVTAWRKKGQSSPAVAKLGVNDLGKIFAAPYFTKEAGLAAAGLIEHRTGKKVTVFEESSLNGSSQYKLTINHALPATASSYPGEKQGLPHASVYDLSKQIHGLGPSMPTPSELKQKITDAIHSDDFVVADWLTHFGQHHGLLGESALPAAGETAADTASKNNASLASQLDYKHVPISAFTIQTVFAKLKNPSTTSADVQSFAKAAATSKLPQVAAALAQLTFSKMSQAASIATGFQQAGLSATMAMVQPGDHSAGYKVVVNGVHPNHVAALTAGATISDAAPKQFTKEPPLFGVLPAGTPPLNKAGVAHLYSMARSFGAGKLGNYASTVANSIEQMPQRMYHLATTPMTPLMAKRFAKLINDHGKLFTAELAKVKDSGSGANAKFVLHFTSRTSSVPVMGDFEQHFKAKMGGADPITSQTPLGLKIANSSLLPPGIDKHDLVQSTPSARAKKIASLKASGENAAAQFLEAHYANLDAQPIHQQAEKEKLFVGATANLPNPLLRAHEVLHQVYNGVGVGPNGEGAAKIANMPHGVTPSMLDATDAQDQNMALAEAGKASNLSRNWLKEYYAARRTASSGGASYAGAPSLIPKASAHHEFSDKSFQFPPIRMNQTTESEFSPNFKSITVPYETGRTTAHQNSVVAQRTEPITGSFGSTHDPTHLALQAGKQYSIADIRDLAKAKVDAIFKSLHAEHQARIADGDGEATQSPFDDVPDEGVNPLARHGHEMAIRHFEPMLHAARAATPSEAVLRQMSPGLTHEPRYRDVAKGIFDSLISQMGVRPEAVERFRNDHQTWFGSTQNDPSRRLRVATNLLRGRAPHENVFPNTSEDDSVADGLKLAKTATPDYMKVYLAHKAALQAAMERYVDKDGDLLFTRGIDPDPANGMLGKTAVQALSEGKEGSRFHGHEMTLAGASLKHAYSGSGAVLHRVARPETVWHSFKFAPTHGTESGISEEVEHFITSTNGGPTYTLVHDLPDVKGNYVTTKSASYNPATQRMWEGTQVTKALLRAAQMVKALDAARSVIRPTYDDHGIPVPKDREGWYRYVPENWAPSRAHIEACLAAFTDPDGVIRMDLNRDDGLRERYSSPETLAHARAGTLMPSTMSRRVMV